MSENAICLDMDEQNRRLQKLKALKQSRRNNVDRATSIKVLVKILAVVLIIIGIIAASTIQAYAYVETDSNLEFELSPVKFQVKSEPVKQLTDNHYRLETDFTRVDFMVDDLRGTPHLAYNTSVYSGKYIENSAYTKAYQYNQIDMHGMPVHLYSFKRDELVHAPDLKQNFLYIEVEVERQILLSLHVASEKEINPLYWIERLIYKANAADEAFVSGDEEILIDGETTEIVSIEMIRNDEVVEVVEAVDISVDASEDTYIVYENSESTFEHDKTQNYYNETFVDNESVDWGIFDPSTHYELTYVDNIEEYTGIEFDIILEYYDLGYLPRVDKMKEITESGRVLELTYQISKYGAFNADALYEVLDGKHDDTIDDLIARIKELDEPVLFRPNNEMNGDWCSYNAMYTHKDTEVYNEFWRWLHDRFEEAGADNVIWVWNPNWGDFPNAQWNHYLNYFPGEKYVDVVGLTGYNTGTYYQDETWRSFTEIYNPMIEEYNLHFKGFPYMITEFGSSSIGGNKGAWIHAALNEIDNLGVKAAVWWNHVDYDTQMGVVSREYKFDEDPDLMHIFRMNFQED